MKHNFVAPLMTKLNSAIEFANICAEQKLKSAILIVNITVYLKNNRRYK